MCSAFRTFQGWTALSDMAHDQGVLQTVPIPGAMAYLMLRPLLPDVPYDEMCGVTVDQVFPASDRWHPLLMQALSGIPDVQAGDSVWWHCDMIHSVAPVTSQRGWGNVMYIPAAPWCPRNEEYAASVREAFVTGLSPADFQPSTTSAPGLTASIWRTSMKRDGAASASADRQPSATADPGPASEARAPGRFRCLTSTIQRRQVSRCTARRWSPARGVPIRASGRG